MQIKTVALLHALVTKQVVARGRKWPVVASAGGGVHLFSGQESSRTWCTGRDSNLALEGSKRDFYVEVTRGSPRPLLNSHAQAAERWFETTLVRTPNIRASGLWLYRGKWQWAPPSWARLCPKVYKKSQMTVSHIFFKWMKLQVKVHPGLSAAGKWLAVKRGFFFFRSLHHPQYSTDIYWFQEQLKQNIFWDRAFSEWFDPRDRLVSQRKVYQAFLAVLWSLHLLIYIKVSEFIG